MFVIFTVNLLTSLVRFAACFTFSLAILFYAHYLNINHIHVSILVNSFSLTLIFLGLVFGVQKLTKNGWIISVVTSTAIVFSSWIGAFTHRGWIEEKVFNVKTEPSIDLPSIVHIILDEHAGIEGLPESIPEANAAREQIMAFHKGNDFLIFTNAFSSHFDSRKSIAASMNFLTGTWNEELVFTNQINWRTTSSMDGRFNYALAKNDVFRQVENFGYIIKSYGPTYMDFCDAESYAISSCYVYDYSLGALSDTDLSKWNKALIILGQFLDSRNQYRHILKRVSDTLSAVDPERKMLPIIDIPINRITPITAMTPFRELFKHIKSNPTGVYYFAHMFFPHYPYVYDQSCNVKADVTKRAKRSSLNNNTTSMTNARDLDYKAYSMQLSCLYLVLGNYFDQLRKENLLENLIVILHGDHGSRILQEPPTSQLVDSSTWNLQLARDGFSTHFSVKAPGFEGGINSEPGIVQELLKQFIQSEFDPGQIDPASKKVEVFLENNEENSSPVKVELPLH